jgi:hypothetical protein
LEEKSLEAPPPPLLTNHSKKGVGEGWGGGDGGRGWDGGGDGGREGADVPVPSSPSALRGRKRRRRRLPREESPMRSRPSRERRPGMQPCGALLTWIRGSWVGSKTNPPTAKCVFLTGGGFDSRVGLVPGAAGFQPDSIPFLGYPNEASPVWP